MKPQEQFERYDWQHGKIQEHNCGDYVKYADVKYLEQKLSSKNQDVKKVCEVLIDSCITRWKSGFYCKECKGEDDYFPYKIVHSKDCPVTIAQKLLKQIGE